ncbi:unnamed protein product [Schistosoma margrebowiei]|uniref:Uncharacterized protein n=1 Tax=Schistosoma margrebowiei TaxID=48269 RepID=A0A183LHP2_9TREM|nr:unnamed protein product [Schistosoma margrebowiei]
MAVGGSQQETLNPGFVLLGTRQQGVPVILRELVLPGGFDLVSPSFTVRDITNELSEPIKTSKHEYLTADLGGRSTCSQYTKEICRKIEEKASNR